MASNEQQVKVVDKVGPSEFFQKIGDKVQSLNVATNESGEGEEDMKFVEEIESLCMNCHENVSCRATIFVLAKK